MWLRASSYVQDATNAALLQEVLVMEINRNQYFMIGVVILILGIQFKTVDTYVFNQPTSQMIAKRMEATPDGAAGVTARTISTVNPNYRHEWRPPKWIGWALLSVGCVLILHSLAMQRPN